jgi:carboxyl-terminal processing protease
MEIIRTNRYIGTGVQIRVHDSGYTQIVTPTRDGPAHRAGARPGDLIVAIDGKEMKGTSIGDIVKLLQGKEGVPVTVRVRQPKTEETRELNIVRGIALFDSACGHSRTKDNEWDYRIANEPIAYLRIRSFSSSTLHELRSLEAQVLSGNARAVVVDVRDAHLGGVHEAALVADGFIDGGVMWRLRGPGGRVTEYKADRDCLFRGLPLAILVNQRTTGAGAELLTTALQDCRKAVVIGEGMLGEGFVQAMVPVEGGGMLWMRTAAIERVAKDRPHNGVQADHIVKLPEAQQKRIGEWLQRKELTELPEGDDGKAPADPQLARAVEVLRTVLKTVRVEAIF